MVVDEWASREDFESFFNEEREPISRLFADAGVTGEPEVAYWQQLRTGDDVG
jgi:hypothetical protein